jgi:hypothetical protein
VNDESEETWKETIASYFKDLFEFILGIEQNDGNTLSELPVH